MSTQKIANERWTEYFDNLSRVTDSQVIKIEVAGLSIGDQIVADWSDFQGISYSPKDDVVTVHAESLSHMIKHPRQVFVVEESTREKQGLNSIEVVDADDNQHILFLKASA